MIRRSLVDSCSLISHNCVMCCTESSRCVMCRSCTRLVRKNSAPTSPSSTRFFVLRATSSCGKCLLSTRTLLTGASTSPSGVRCLETSNMECSPSVRSAQTFTVYTDIYSVHGHLQCTRTFTVYTDIYSVHGHLQCTQTFTVYTDIYSVHGHLQCTRTFTVYTDIYSVHRHLQCTRTFTRALTVYMETHNARRHSQGAFKK